MWWILFILLTLVPIPFKGRRCQRVGPVGQPPKRLTDLCSNNGLNAHTRGVWTCFVSSP